MRSFFAVLLVFCVLLIPLWYKSVMSVKYRNFRVVDEGVLYRSGQMKPEGFDRVVREFGIKTVISLREAGNGHDDDTEEAYCKMHDIAFHRFPLADWEPIKGVIPGDLNIKRFLELMRDSNTKKPVLIHCFAGIHRTGPHCFAYRVEFQGWSNAEAIKEMEAMGTIRTTFAPNLESYLMNYTPKR